MAEVLYLYKPYIGRSGGISEFQDRGQGKADAAQWVPQYLVPAPETMRMNLALGLVVRWWRTLGEFQVVGDDESGRWVTEQEEGLCPEGFISGRRPGAGVVGPTPSLTFPSRRGETSRAITPSVDSRQQGPNPTSIAIQHIIALGDMQHYGPDGS